MWSGICPEFGEGSNSCEPEWCEKHLQRILHDFSAEHACLVTFLKTAVQAVSCNWKIQWWLEGLFSKSRKMLWEWIICLDTEGWVRENGLSRRQVGLKPRTVGSDCSEGQFQAQALRFSPCTPTQLPSSGFFQWSLSENSREESTGWGKKEKASLPSTDLLIAHWMPCPQSPIR